METRTAVEPGPWRALAQSDRVARLLVLCAGVWLHAADSLMVATLMPDAARELQGVSYMGWTIALYIVGSIVAGATGGVLAMRFGIRQAMTGSATFFSLGCVLSAVAPDIWTVLAGRLMQGLGGGAMLALTFVGIEGLFPARLTGAVMAVISAVWGASAFCGPLIGGIFAHYGMWRWGFGAFAIQALLVAALTVWLLPGGQSDRRDDGPTPYPRLLLLAVAIMAIAAAGNWTSLGLSGASIVTGIAMLVLFFRTDSRAANGLMPRTAGSPRTGTGSGILFVMLLAAGTIAFTVYGPLLLQFRFGVSPLVGGYFVAMESVSWTAAALLVAQASERMEPWVIRAGAVIAAVGAIGLIWAMPHGSLWAIAPLVACLGAGFGAFWAFVLKRTVAATPEAEREKAAAALPTSQLIGYAIGAALTGFYANAAGLTENPTPETVRAVGFWIFAGFVPVLAAGLLMLPRLTSSERASAVEAGRR
ncbi:MFS transporter [Minwuia sp.]|uniref:MFS transporter n=1 Tax=Minwuia sp. TaxID=2493630 RepID=UPI003A8D44C1